MDERFTNCLVLKRERQKNHMYAVVLLGKQKVGGQVKRIQKQVGSYRTHKEALKKKIEYDHQLQTSKVVAPTHITFGDYLDRWLKEYVVHGSYKERTKETYEAVIEGHVKPALGDIELQNLGVNDIDRYYSENRKKEKRLSEVTLQQHHAIIHKALQVAMVSERLINSNPAEMVLNKPKRRKGGKIPEVWTEDEFHAVLDAAKRMGPRQAAFYRMALETGMRKGELCGLSWQDVALHDGCGEVIVRKQLIRAGRKWRSGTPKSGRERAIAISDELVSDLRNWRIIQAALNRGLSKERQTDFVFTGTNGGPLPMNNIGQREFADLIEEAMVSKISFHGMRHTSASLLLSKGAAIKLVSERLGHASVGTTMEIYCHSDRKAHREIANLFQREATSKGRNDASERTGSPLMPEKVSTALDYRH